MNISPISLVDSLVKLVAMIVKGYELPTKEGINREPKIFAQMLPTKNFDETVTNSDCPFVVIAFNGWRYGNSSEIAKAICSISFIIGAFYEQPFDEMELKENDGWRISTDIAWRISSDLCKNPRVDTAFLTSINCDYEPEQPMPFWYNVLDTEWEIPMQNDSQIDLEKNFDFHM